MMTQPKTMFAAAVELRPPVPPELLARANAEAARRYESNRDVRRGYFKHGYLDRALGNPESRFQVGANVRHYRAGWNAAAAADPSIIDREEMAMVDADHRRREQLVQEYEQAVQP